MGFGFCLDRVRSCEPAFQKRSMTRPVQRNGERSAVRQLDQFAIGIAPPSRSEAVVPSVNRAARLAAAMASTLRVLAIDLETWKGV